MAAQKSDLVVLYHGTDVDSALDILNHGLNAERLIALQIDRPTQLGPGWYAATDVDTAWLFASLAPGIHSEYTVIEVALTELELNTLLTRGLAVRLPIANVPFEATRIGFTWIRLSI
jgi:hypothetical protein